MMRSFIKFADRLSISMGKAFSWCIVILMGGTCYEVFRCIICIQTGSWPTRDSADAEETEKLLMRAAQKGNTDDVI